MYKIWKYYNQNRVQVWTVILAIVLGFSLIKSLNNQLKNQNSQKNNTNKETTSNVVSYRNESKYMVTEGNVPSKYQEDFGEFINKFFTACIEHDPQTAYNMVSNDTKQELYQTEELFEKNYYENKFAGDKQFSFQSWSSSDGIYIYQIKIFDNMLASGKTNDNYIEEYVALKSENGEYKLNLNSYLGRKTINRKTEDDNLTVQVLRVDSYLDYEIYTMSIQNKTSKKILLDTKRKTNTCYVQDTLKNKFEALLYENKDEDLIFKPSEVKTIRIKFSDANRSNKDIKSINFTDIVDETEYINNAKLEGESFKAEI